MLWYNNDLGTLSFTQNESGEWGYKVGGADTVYPFKNLEKDTIATATPEQITEGYTAWVNGKLITGTRPNPVTELTGTMTATLKVGSTVSNYVTFSTPFDKVPTVVTIHLYPSNSSKYYCSVSNVSVNGFKWTMGGQSYGSDSVTFKWTARAN